MANASTKRKVTIEYGVSSRIPNQKAQSFKTRDLKSAMNIVRGLPLCRVAWFAGKQIFLNEKLEAIS